MRRVAFIAFATLLPLASWAAGGDAHSAEGHAAEGHGGIPLHDIGVHALNFTILVTVLFLLLRGPIRDALRNRASGIKAELEEANALRKAAQDRVDELETRIRGFEKLVEELKAEGAASAEREADLIAERAEREVELVKASAERTIREETRKARGALRQQAVDLAVRIAEEQLRSRIDEKDQERLAQDFLSTVKGETAHG